MDGAISKMKDNSKLDAVPIRNLGEFSRGEDRPGLITQDEESVRGTCSMSNLQVIQILALQPAMWSEQGNRNQSDRKVVVEACAQGLTT
jgi:hypothetical protein